MLEPQSRATLAEQLTPPFGYELSYAVGTTFTLDLATALTVPLSFASHRITAADDTLGVLEAIRRASDHVDIFAQAGELSMRGASDLVAFLEPMVHPVLPRRGLFHPKVWFLEYRSGERLKHRFICASRNLTADRSWDVVVRLDGEPAGPGDKREAAAVNRPLVALLQRLPGLCVQPMERARRDNLLALAERWRTVEWENPDATRRLAFHVLGIPGAAMPEIAGKRALIVSPFLSDDGLAMLRSRVTADTHLISHAESLDLLDPATLDPKLKTYVLDDAATLNGDDESDADGAQIRPRERLSGLHAKVIVVDRFDGSHVFLGSANATRGAWKENVEVMVELVGALGSVGVEATLRALGDLKDEYPTDGGHEESADEKAERALEGLVRRFAGVRVMARVVEGDPYTLRVWADESLEGPMREAAKKGVTISWHLLTRADFGGGSLATDESAASVLTGIPLTDITPFIVLVARDADGRERRTIIVARLLGDIADRREAIIARQLTDRAAFVRLLTLLLDLSGVAFPAADAVGGPTGFFGAAQGDDAGSGLFEALVRAVGAGNRGLADARRIIDFVRDHGDENAVLPEGFEALWASVWEAHLELRGSNA